MCCFCGALLRAQTPPCANRCQLLHSTDLSHHIHAYTGSVDSKATPVYNQLKSPADAFGQSPLSSTCNHAMPNTRQIDCAWDQGKGMDLVLEPFGIASIHRKQEKDTVSPYRIQASSRRPHSCPSDHVLECS